MMIGLGQFAVTSDWQRNLAQCGHYMQAAEEQGVSLLVLPEAVLATDIDDPLCVIREAQPLKGPFVRQLLALSAPLQLAVVMTIHVPTSTGRVANLLLMVQQGKIIAQYHKLHLYDAFAMQESTHVDAGTALPPVVTVGGLKVGMMTCYDLRFPEMARSLALRGAELIVVPAAWVRGPCKEHHWTTLLTARALDTTCYLAGVSECGPRNIGSSLLVDPLGVVTARAAEAPALIVAPLSRQRLTHVRNSLPVLANSCFQPPALR